MGRRTCTLATTSVALVLSALGAVPAAQAADTFTAPAYSDIDCQVAFGSYQLALPPDMIASVVGLPIALPATPAPQTVVVVSLGQSVDQADVRGFLQFCGLSPVTWTDVLNPGDIAPALGGEAALDLTVIAGLLPPNTTLKTATIADNIDFLAALLNAGRACGLDGSDPTQWNRSQLDTPTGGCIATMSYAIFEQSLRDALTLEGLTTTAQQNQYIADVEVTLTALASSGVITLVSSGDEGSGGCQPLTRGKRNIMAPQWPSTSSNVVSVGGTMWAPPNWNGAAITPTSYVPGSTLMPVSWRNWGMGSDCDWVDGVTEWPGIGTTGGISTFATRPGYQDSVVGIAPGSTGRLSPDLSALAGWPAWLVPSSAGPGVTYEMGTSAASPLVAAGLAQVNAALTSRGLAPLDNAGGAMDVHEVIYSPAFSSAFNDVTQGTNNLWSSDLWTAPTAVTTVSYLQGIGFLDGSATPTANGSGTMTGYSAGVGYDLATGMGVPNFSTLAQLLIDAQRPAPGGPPPVLQQLPAPDTGSCDLAVTTYDWGGSSSGGWSKSWAQWANGGTGGAVCTRTLVYSNALRHWIVQR